MATVFWFRRNLPGVGPASSLEDLTTLWCQRYLGVVMGVTALDANAAVSGDLTSVLGYDSETDLNTAYAKYLDTEF